MYIVVAYTMYRHKNIAGPSETGVEWESPGVQRLGENRGPRDARNYSRVGWPILTDTAEGTADGTTKGGEKASGGSRGGEQSSTPRGRSQRTVEVRRYGPAESYD
jgi:hypothetical protein